MKPSFVMGLVSSSLTVIGFSVLASSFSSAKAASFTFDQSKLNLYGGSTPVNFNIDLDDTAAGEGKVQFKVNVAQGFFADLRGVFFHVKDESLLSGLNVLGKDLTQVVKSANSVVDLGGGNNLNGDGKGKNAGSIAGGFDVGVEIGTQGIGKDDIRSTTFVVSHAAKKLSLSDFADQLFGIRLMSVGADRAGSSKLTGSLPSLPPVPPPVVSNPEPPKPPVVSQPEPPKPLPQPVVSNPEPPKPPVVNQPESPKPLPQPIVSQPEPPKPLPQPVVSNPEPPKPVPQPIVSQPESPKPLPQPVVSEPEPPKPPVVNQPEPPKPLPQPVVSNPEPPKPVPQPIVSQPESPKPLLPPVVIQPAPEVVKPVLPPVAIDSTPPKKQEPVEVPEPSTLFLALASVGALKVLKRKSQLSQPQS